MGLPPRRVDMKVGSAEWARSTIEYARNRYHSKQITEERWLEVLAELRAGRAWVPLGKRSLDDLLKAEIGVTAGESVRAVQELGTHGGDRKSEQAKNQPCNASLKYGTSDYWVARLTRDGHTALVAQVEVGDLSAHAAALRVGYRKTKTPLQHLRHWWGKATKDERATFRAEVSA